ncbi:PAS domain S-box protein [Mesobacillus zeae]|uniref:histidine kinase n=1 Tax=Mesobacillus zeae TaxID=1917180 RepID=A0A398BDM7_9BACI|nr:PAS domain S-box protein [Mesobacillus zeae]RID88275.1 PAS domain S-box protein [Mesobacillus zeae]
MTEKPVDFESKQAVDFSLFDAVGAGIVIRNREGEILFANKAFCNLFGTNREELKGRMSFGSLIRFVTEDGKDVQEFAEYPSFQTIHTGKKSEAVWSLKEQKERAAWFRLAADTAYFGSNHQPLIISTVTDITEEKMAKEKCLDSEQRFECLIQSMDELIFTIDSNIQYTAVYGRWFEKNGIPESSLLGKSVYGIVDREKEPLHQIAINHAFNGKSYTYECQIEIGGKWYDFHVSFSPLKSKDGWIKSIIGVARDITSEKRIKKQLKLSQDLYETLIELSPEMIFVQMNGKIVYMNEAGIKSLKASCLTELKGKSIYDIIHPDYHKVVKNRIRELKRNKHVGLLEEKYICMDGSTKYFEVASTLIKIGKKTGSIVFARDVTAKRKADQLLRESEERFRQLAENINDIFWIKDIETGEYIYISPALDKLTGPVSIHSCPESVSPLQPLIPAGEQKNLINQDGLIRSYRIQPESGETRWIKERIFYIYNDSPEPIRIAGVAEDITMLTERQELLQKQKRLMIIQNLAAGIAHEIRNPLTSIKGFMQLLQNFVPEEYFYIIDIEIKNIEKFIKQMLLLGKDSEGKEVKKVSILSILLDVIQVFSPTDLFPCILFDHGNLSRSDYIMGDADQLKEVLINILDNSINSIIRKETGQVWIGTERIGDNVFITVADNGSGISPDRFELLGEPYYANHEKGIGLGLMICQKIIENHSGELTIISKEDEGTTVKIRIPVNGLAKDSFGKQNPGISME